MMRIIGCLSLVFAAACAVDATGGVEPSSKSLLEQGKMIIYTPGPAVPEAELTEITPPGGLNPGDNFLGGTVLEGNVKISVRIDHASGPVTGGIFQASRGKVRIVFPFTEHATVLKGKVNLTDETGQTHTWVEGESYLIKQGSVILWDVPTSYMQKSFFNVVE